MNTIKTILAGLLAASASMASINGIVMDSAKVGIGGAIIKLEKGGQTDTTKSDGSFILTIGTNASNQINQTKVNKLSAMMHNGILYVNVPEKADIDVTVFDLTGKVLLSMGQTMVTGIHSIALPYLGAGIFLYKVKAGNNDFVLKGNSVCGFSSGNAKAYQSFASNSPAKQAKVTAAFNDVIKITKDNYLNYRLSVTNSDTSGIVIKVISQDAGTVTDIDGNVYHAIRIGKQVWTVENLRSTKYTDGTAIPLVTTKAEWSAISTPGYCYYNNTTNADSIKKFGALYNWHVISPTNSKQIAPTGWHVPTDAEWDTLGCYLIANGYNFDGTITDTITDNQIAKAMAAKTDWQGNTNRGTISNTLAENNKSGFSALPGGYRDMAGNFYDVGYGSRWWSATEIYESRAYFRYLSYNAINLCKNYYFKFGGYSIKLLKD